MGGWEMRTTTASSAAQAVGLVTEQGPAGRFDVVLLDSHLDRLDGVELARWLNTFPVEGRVPIVLLTSARDQGTASGRPDIASHVAKPLRQSRLREALVLALEGGRVGRTTRASVESTAAPLREAPEVGGLPLVLVAEDNPTNQAVAVRWLERLGFRAEVADDGEAALEALAGMRFAAVLMDCQMPRVDGYEATRELRRREGVERHTPVIAMTAHAMKGDRERCLEAGMDDYLAKPLRPETLRVTLDRWIPVRLDLGDPPRPVERDGSTVAFASNAP